MSQKSRPESQSQVDRGAHFAPGAANAPTDQAPTSQGHFQRGYKDRRATREDNLPENIQRGPEGSFLMGLNVSACMDDLLKVKSEDIFRHLDRFRSQWPDAFNSGKAMSVLIAAAARRRAFHLANSLWEWMDRSGLEKNIFHFNSMISVAEKMRNHRRALALLQEMNDRSVPKNEITYSSAISACEKTSEWQTAVQLLDECEQEGLVESDIVYNATISACQRSLQPQVAMDVFRRMEKQGIRPNEITFSALITAAEKGGQWKLALDLLNDMRSRGIEHSVIAYSSTISALAKGQQWEKALELFREVHIVLVACARLHSLRPVSHFAQLQEFGEQPSIVTYNATMTALEKGMQWERALGLFEEMKMKNMPITVVSYGSAISACDKGLQYRQCLEYLDEMTDIGIEKNVIIFGAALSCMEKCHRADISFLLMDRMKAEGIEPNVHVFNSAISACARCGLWEKGYDLFLSMEEKGVKRDVVTYNATLDAVASQVELGRKIFREGVQLGFYSKVSRLAKNWFELDLHFLSMGGGEIGLGWWIEEAIVPYVEDSTLLKDVKSVTIVTGYGKTRTRGRREGDDGMRKRVLGMLQFMNLEAGEGTNAGRIAIDKSRLVEEARRQGGRIHFDLEGYTEWKRHNTTEFKVPDVPQKIRARFKPEMPGSGRPPFRRVETNQTSPEYRIESDGLTPADRENRRQDEIRKRNGGNDILEDRVPERGGRGAGGRAGRGFSGRGHGRDGGRGRGFESNGGRGGRYGPLQPSANRSNEQYDDSNRYAPPDDGRGNHYGRTHGDRPFGVEGSRVGRGYVRGGGRGFRGGRGRSGYGGRSDGQGYNNGNNRYYQREHYEGSHYRPSGSHHQGYDDLAFDGGKDGSYGPPHQQHAGLKRRLEDSSERQQPNRGYDLDQPSSPRTRPRY